jgi:large subunit ribosomal protein L9
MSNTQIILLERVESLGQMGDVVSVKPGYARNFLLPQGKALRATKDNVAYFEGQKKTLEADSLKLKKEAEAVAKKMNDLKIVIIRSASEAGQLFGSVAARDIAEGITDAGFSIEKSQVELNQNFKMIGFTTASIALHPEVKVEVTLNIARSVEEAKPQDKTGKALIAGADEEVVTRKPVAVEETKADFLEDNALEAEKEQAEIDAEKSAEADVKAAEKAEKKAAKAAAEADAEAATEAAAEEVTEEKAAE